MSDDGPDSLVLRYLRNIDAKLDRLSDDLHDLKIRTTSVEEGLAGVNRRLDRVSRAIRLFDDQGRGHRHDLFGGPRLPR